MTRRDADAPKPKARRGRGDGEGELRKPAQRRETKPAARGRYAALSKAQSPRAQSGEDDNRRSAKHMRRLFRKVRRHIADAWQDDPTEGTDWWTQHQREQRIGGRDHNARADADRKDLARPYGGLLKPKYD